MKLTPQKVQAWLVARAAAGVSARLCQHARVVLRVALQQAVKWDLVARNVAALVDPDLPAFFGPAIAGEGRQLTRSLT